MELRNMTNVIRSFKGWSSLLELYTYLTNNGYSNTFKGFLQEYNTLKEQGKI